MTVRTPAYLGIARLGAGDDDALQAIAARLLAAERPLLITDRAGRDPAAVAALDALAREFGLAVRATRHRLNLPDGHPSRWAGGTYNSAGIARGDGLIGLADADAVLVVDHLVPWIPCASGRPRRPGSRSPVPIPPVRTCRSTSSRPTCGWSWTRHGSWRHLLEAMRAQRTAADRERGGRRWRAFEEHAGSRAGGTRGPRARAAIDDDRSPPAWRRCSRPRTRSRGR